VEVKFYPLTAALDGVGGQRHAPSRFTSEKGPRFPLFRKLNAPGPAGNGAENFASHRDSNPEPSRP